MKKVWTYFAIKSLLERAEKFALPARQSGLFHKTTH